MLIYSYIKTSGIVFTQFRVFPTSTSVDITVYQYGKNVLYLFYNVSIAMSKARRIRKISVFTSGGKFSVFTLSYVNTALNQSAFSIHKCYIIKAVNSLFQTCFNNLEQAVQIGLVNSWWADVLQLFCRFVTT